MNDAGRIGFVLRGEYNPETTYDFLDIVYYNAATYAAKKPTKGNAPVEQDDYWQIIAKGIVTRIKGSAESEYRTGDVDITKEDIGLGDVENKSSETIRSEITADDIIKALGYTPPQTKEDIELGNVDNTSDKDKPVSTAQQEALDKKVDKTDILSGATSTTAGEAGLVPQPQAGDEESFLKGDGTWSPPPKGVPDDEELRLPKGDYNGSSSVSADGYIEIMKIRKIDDWHPYPISFMYGGFGSIPYIFSISFTNNVMASMEPADISYFATGDRSKKSASYEIQPVLAKMADGQWSVYVYTKADHVSNISGLTYNKDHFDITVSNKTNMLSLTKEEISSAAVKVYDFTYLLEATNSAKLEGKTVEDINISNGIVSVRKGIGGTAGWYRIFEQTNNVFGSYGQNFIMSISRSYSNSNNESYIVMLSSTYNANIKWQTLDAISAVKGIDKLRITTLGNKTYIEMRYNLNTSNNVSVKAFYNLGEGSVFLKSAGLELATEDETVLSEYTIPQYPDVGFNKTLTNYIEIPEGADVNTYRTPGCYCCPSDGVAKTLKNSPYQTAFTMFVYYPNMTPSSGYIVQECVTWTGDKVVRRSFNSAGLRGTSTYYPLPTPAPNQVLCTDSNGNLKWLDTPPSSNFVDLGRYSSDEYTIDTAVKDILLNKMKLVNLVGNAIPAFGTFQVGGNIFSCVAMMTSNYIYGSLILFNYNRNGGLRRFVKEQSEVYVAEVQEGSFTKV